MNNQISIAWFDPANGITFHEEFHEGIRRIIDEVPEEFICLVNKDYKGQAQSLLSGSAVFRKSTCIITYLELDASPDSPHREIWEALTGKLLPFLEKKKGNTFHIDSSSAGPVAHAVWAILYYAGQLPHPSNVWIRSPTPSGSVRFVLLQLPVESLNLRLRKAVGGSRKAIYQRDKIKSPQLQNSLDLIITASRIPSLPLLLLGEKGTGKTRLVESVLGAVRDRPVHTVLCGSLQPELAMSQLFGHVKGAFTGADKETAGLIGEAENGIIFFDEIQDLPRTVQRMLVRFLQDPDHLYRRVGASGRESKANVELVFASHKPQEELASLLDSDLYDRISLVTVWIPSLRDFREDLPEIWKQVWLEHGKLADVLVDPQHPALLSWFATYSFPGNLRDLISLALWIQIFYLQFQSSDAALLEAINHIGKCTGNSIKASESNLQYADSSKPLKERVSLFRRALVEEAVSMHGSYSSAARMLNVDEKTIRNTLKTE